MARPPAKHKPAPPAVSVIVVTYESGPTLARCLETLKAQSFRGFELIIVDNASKDRAAQAAADRDPAIRLIANAENLGFAAAVNQGYKLIAQLTGGVLVGVALGFGIDAYAGTAPGGIIAGTLLGFGVSVWLAVRTARKLQEDALKEHGPGKAVPFDDDEDEGA